MGKLRLRYGIRNAPQSKHGGFAWHLTDGEHICWLTPHQTDLIFTLLMNDHQATTEEIMEQMWPDPDTMPDYWNDNIRVHVCRLREKLLTFGWTIASGWNHRWYLVRERDLEKSGCSKQYRPTLKRGSSTS